MKKRFCFIIVLLILLQPSLSFSSSKISSLDLFEQVFGTKKNNKSVLLEIPILLDEESVGFANVSINAIKKTTSVDKKIIIEVLKNVLKKQTFSKLLVKIEKVDSKKIEIETISISGLEITLDEKDLVLKINTSPSVRKTSTRVLKKYSKLNMDFSKIDNLNNSATLDLSINQPFSNTSVNNSIQKDSIRINASAQTNHKGILFNTELGYIGEQGGSVSTARSAYVYRGKTYVSHVDIEENTRYLFGESQLLAPSDGTAYPVFGFNIQKEKGKYNFNKKAQQRITSRTIFLETDSTVEIIVNDRVTNRLSLKAGTHDLLDFPLLAGYNEIVLSIEDANGKITEKVFEDFYYGAILNEGEDNFGISTGVMTTSKNNKIE